ncbi:MAG: FadR/GntR family transcriptional regulator [Chloroflexi bacterium]|nr:FadR/GntR family transcriptional regulator [Chloroflexota bacterium]
MQPIQRIKPFDVPTMHVELQERFKEYILVNKLQPGDPLPTEAQLAEQLGVSRAAVREGLRSLESLGVIYSRRGEGRYVRGFNLDPILQNLRYSMLFDTEDLRQMIEVREQLEMGFVPAAIAAMDPATLVELHDLVDQMRQRALAEGYFLDKDLEFHAAIYRPINNQVLSKLLEVFCTIYKNLRDRSLLTMKNAVSEVGNHEAILNAIEARDVALARRLIRDHFSGIKERISAARLVNTAGSKTK